MRSKILKSINSILNTSKLILHKQKPLIAFWWEEPEGKNWGDALNPILIKNISGKEPVLYDEIINFENLPVYSVVGSILQNYPNKNLIVWGSGFISSSSKFKVKPQKICAVRGPLTRDLIIKQGIECPEIYGDPALLYPLFYKPAIKKKYRLGIIPHYVDRDNPLLKIFRQDQDVIIIDIFAGINEVVDNICRCECIASSSLHGIIAADAYGVPSIWIELSDKVVGNRFKFLDYFMSIGRKDEEPLIMTENTTLQDIYNRYHKYEIYLDLVKLLEACPFLKDTGIDELKNRLKSLYCNVK